MILNVSYIGFVPVFHRQDAMLRDAREVSVSQYQAPAGMACGTVTQLYVSCLQLAGL